MIWRLKHPFLLIFWTKKIFRTRIRDPLGPISGPGPDWVRKFWTRVNTRRPRQSSCGSTWNPGAAAPAAFVAAPPPSPHWQRR